MQREIKIDRKDFHVSEGQRLTLTTTEIFEDGKLVNTSKKVETHIVGNLDFFELKNLHAIIPLIIKEWSR